MGMFYSVSLPGHEDRELISRDQNHDQERPGPWDFKTQTHAETGDPLDPARFREGEEIKLEDWSRDADCIFRMKDGRWIEIDRKPW